MKWQAGRAAETRIIIGHIARSNPVPQNKCTGQGDSRRRVKGSTLQKCGRGPSRSPQAAADRQATEIIICAALQAAPHFHCFSRRSCGGLGL